MNLSPAALEVAAREAKAAGCSGIDYRIANLDQLTLPAASFDAVFVHQALHHVENLESCLDVVARALRPGGILYIDEYVGPSRHEWKRGDLDRLREVFVTLPAPARRVRRFAATEDRWMAEGEKSYYVTAVYRRR